MDTNATDHTPSNTVVDADSASHILHPHRQPDEVVSAPLSTDEKRAILASWVSDLHAVESLPELRHPPGVANPVRYRDSLDALQKLDERWNEDWQKEPAQRRSFQS
ncbi:hypothetical protein EHI47_26905 [Rhizobium leguminosarum]|uniref:Uncharacterized protein n=1 Tax=Rhizobium leguminosarum TaxID=384 RepID=A0A444HQS3_RHILE|nr:hypothetical protein [Rhizobium leguminosarum]RWX16920.1 hypothetical protein EHI45_06975 [Rhizobium leguminosarum]RWX25117.1 hypothetical protein EHI47_26905 [Rhizobium leguminosarum]